MAFDATKAPFPWFGGKSRAAAAVWQALGDVEHYVEPFAGSLAVLLRRPHEANRTYHSETVNDFDGLLINAWRSIQLSPEATAEACSWPVSEPDLSARHLALVRWREACNAALLRGDPTWHDPVMAGWWLYGVCAWIGSGWCAGTGAWTADETGRLYRQGPRGRGAREPGVDGKRPHLGNNGMGVHAPQLREPGVASQRPHLGNNGMGVHHAGLREPGVAGQLQHLADDGKGVHHAGLREPAWMAGDGEPHPVVMPRLLRWFRLLSARLRHVRIVSGDWRRVCTCGAIETLSVRQGGTAGIFLDPPYAKAERCDGIYACDDGDIAADVRAWCLRNTDKPWRIVLAGYAGEGHEALEARGWTPVEWYEGGWLQGGMANIGEDESQDERERLWLSPACIRPRKAQRSLFGEED